MAFQMKSTYVGDLRTTAEHLKSGVKIVTDAPTDNMGKGESFSPTDLLCTALATCKMTTMGIVAQREGVNVDLSGMTCEIEKIMSAEPPRRVAEIVIKLHLPIADTLNDKQKTILRNAALKCPVALSLAPEVKQTVTFNF